MSKFMKQVKTKRDYRNTLIREIAVEADRQLWSFFITRSLDNHTRNLLSLIIYVSLCQMQTLILKTPRCNPGRKYLAKFLNLHPDTVSRHITILKKAGLLRVVRRKNTKGEWTTNLYCFGEMLWLALKSITKRYFSFFNRLTQRSDINFKEERIYKKSIFFKEKEPETDPSTQKWLAKFKEKSDEHFKEEGLKAT